MVPRGLKETTTCSKKNGTGRQGLKIFAAVCRATVAKRVIAEPTCRARWIEDAVAEREQLRRRQLLVEPVDRTPTRKVGRLVQEPGCSGHRARHPPQRPPRTINLRKATIIKRAVTCIAAEL